MSMYIFSNSSQGSVVREQEKAIVLGASYMLKPVVESAPAPDPRPLIPDPRELIPYSSHIGVSVA